jgi:hypothetical protein
MSGFLENPRTKFVPLSTPDGRDRSFVALIIRDRIV